MKRTILIFALSRSPWIGGIYYRKNITHMLLANKKMEKYQIVILVNEKYKNVFETFRPHVNVVTCADQTGSVKAMFKILKCCMKYKVKYIFPFKPYRFMKLMGIVPVSWIADFQHCHYPEFFEVSEIIKRNKDCRKIAKASNPLVLSSYDARNDFNTYFGDRKNIHVVHFSSYIEDELQKLKPENEKEILNKFSFTDERYVIICNQFWQHKNHKVVLQMIKGMRENHPEINLKFVFTGELNDRRNPDYIDEIRMLLNEKEVKDKVCVLGFIDRTEQLCLMKYAQFIIQPSLFEGWGTVVEDGKILGKKMILSDIPVHLEQKTEESLIFESTNPDSLLQAILQIEKQSDLEKASAKVDLTEQYALTLEEVFL